MCINYRPVIQQETISSRQIAISEMQFILVIENNHVIARSCAPFLPPSFASPGALLAVVGFQGILCCNFN